MPRFSGLAQQGRSPTLVVAASDASILAKNSADYVCDGVADNVEIQAAINALPIVPSPGNNRPGGTIVLSEGTFNVGAQIDLNPGGVIIDFIIRGQGMAATRLNLGFDGRMFSATRADNEIGIGGMFDFLAEGNWSSRTAGTFFYGMPFAFTFERLYVKDFRDYGINTSRGVGGGGFDRAIHINNCLLLDNNVSIYASAVNGTSVTENSIDGRLTGIVIDGSMLWHIFNNGMGTPFLAGGQFIKLLSTVNPTRDIYLKGNHYDVSDDAGGTNSLTAVIDLAGNNITEVSIRGEKFWAQRSPAEAPTVIKVAVAGTILNMLITDCEVNYTVDETGVEFHPTKFLDVANLQGLVMWNNKLSHDGSAVASTTPSSGYTSIKNNRGYTTENSGTATVANGTTSIVINHGLATTPTRVFVTSRLWSNSTKSWITTIGATQFTINVDADPGAGTAIFDWHAQVGEG